MAAVQRKLKLKTIRDEISGKPRVIENPLFPEHIKKGAYVWYDGTTSMTTWNCPAVIIEVDYAKRRFRIQSLDDMKEQLDWYTFGVTARSPHARKCMRVATEQEVRDYVQKRLAHHDHEVLIGKQHVEEEEDKRSKYRLAASKLGLK